MASGRKTLPEKIKLKDIEFRAYKFHSKSCRLASRKVRQRMRRKFKRGSKFRYEQTDLCSD